MESAAEFRNNQEASVAGAGQARRDERKEAQL
jgi:hypothetical protein